MKGDKTVNVHHIKPFLFNQLIAVLSLLSLNSFFILTPKSLLLYSVEEAGKMTPPDNTVTTKNVYILLMKTRWKR